MKHQSVMLSALVALAIAAPVAAQTTQQSSLSQSIGGGAQWAIPVSDVDLKGSPGLNASWRYWSGPHLGLEGTFGWWRNRDRGEFHYQGFTLPDGTVIDPQHVTYNQTLACYGLGVNLMGRIPIGRASFVIGGGPGYFFERAGFNANVNGTNHSDGGHASHFGVQGVTEVDVRVTERVSAFGGFRIEVRDIHYTDSGFAYPLVGLRLHF